MLNPIQKSQSFFLRWISSVLVIALFLTSIPVPLAQAQELRLPAPGVMVHLSPEFKPAVLKGITVHPDNPFKFDFILDRGEGDLSNDQLKDESQRLVKYFLSAITTPENDLWVNLSPYETQRIVPESFGQTDMGRDLLAQDYLLKQITASLIYPEDEIGKQFWKRVYEEAVKKFGKTTIPVNTFNKVWIVPNKAKVYEHGNTAFVVNANLKVMLEQDYLALDKNTLTSAASKQPNNEVNALGSQIVREIVIPQLEKEVNEGKNFSKLRQVYNSLILAVWFKKRMKDSVLGRKYMDKNKVMGIDIEDKDSKQKIYEQYLKAFKKGVYNYIKEEADSITKQMIPRKYFSGGFAVGDFAMHSFEETREISTEELPDEKDLAMVTVNLANQNSDPAKKGPNRVVNQRTFGEVDHAMNTKAIQISRAVDYLKGRASIKGNRFMYDDLDIDGLAKTDFSRPKVLASIKSLLLTNQIFTKRYVDFYKQERISNQQIKNFERLMNISLTASDSDIVNAILKYFSNISLATANYEISVGLIRFFKSHQGSMASADLLENFNDPTPRINDYFRKETRSTGWKLYLNIHYHYLKEALEFLKANHFTYKLAGNGFPGAQVDVYCSSWENVNKESEFIASKIRSYLVNTEPASEYKYESSEQAILLNSGLLARFTVDYRIAQDSEFSWYGGRYGIPKISNQDKNPKEGFEYVYNKFGDYFYPIDSAQLSEADQAMNTTIDYLSSVLTQQPDTFYARPRFRTVYSSGNYTSNLIKEGVLIQKEGEQYPRVVDFSWGGELEKKYPQADHGDIRRDLLASNPNHYSFEISGNSLLTGWTMEILTFTLETEMRDAQDKHSLKTVLIRGEGDSIYELTPGPLGVYYSSRLRSESSPRGKGPAGLVLFSDGYSSGPSSDLNQEGDRNSEGVFGVQFFDSTGKALGRPIRPQVLAGRKNLIDWVSVLQSAPKPFTHFKVFRTTRERKTAIETFYVQPQVGLSVVDILPLKSSTGSRYISHGGNKVEAVVNLYNEMSQIRKVLAESYSKSQDFNKYLTEIAPAVWKLVNIFNSLRGTRNKKLYKALYLLARTAKEQIKEKRPIGVSSTGANSLERLLTLKIPTPSNYPTRESLKGTFADGIVWPGDFDNAQLSEADLAMNSSMPKMTREEIEQDFYTGNLTPDEKLQILLSRLRKGSNGDIISALVAQGDNVQPYIDRFVNQLTPGHLALPQFLPVFLRSIKNLSSQQLTRFLTNGFSSEVVIAVVNELGNRADHEAQSALTTMFISGYVDKEDIQKGWVASFINTDDIYINNILDSYFRRLSDRPQQESRRILSQLGKKLRLALVARLKPEIGPTYRSQILDLLSEVPESQDAPHYLREGHVINETSLRALVNMGDASSREILINDLSHILDKVLGWENNASVYPKLDLIAKGLQPEKERAIAELGKLSKAKPQMAVYLRVLYLILKLDPIEGFAQAMEVMKIIDSETDYRWKALTLILDMLAGAPILSSQDVYHVVHEVMTPSQRRQYRIMAVNLRTIDLPFSFLEAIYPETIGQKGPFSASDFVDGDDPSKNDEIRKGLEGYTIEVWNPNVSEVVRTETARQINQIIDSAGFKGKDKMSTRSVDAFLAVDNPKERIYRERVLLEKDPQGRIIGFAFYDARDGYPFMGFLPYMAVDENDRQDKIHGKKGKGAGSALLSKVVADLTSLGRIALNLKAADSTHASLFYYRYSESRKAQGVGYSATTHDSAPSTLEFPEFSRSHVLSSHDFQRKTPFIPLADSAMGAKTVQEFMPGKDRKGGIDLTADRIKLDIDSDKAAVSQSMDLKALENIEINGLYIKDIEIKPLENLPHLLGVGYG